MIAILAALPREIAGLVRGLAPDRELKRSGIHLYRLRDGEVCVACAGMGSERVLMAARAAARMGTVEQFISTGLAGSCDPALKAGSVVEANRLIDVRSGERLEVQTSLEGARSRRCPCKVRW